MPIPKTLANSKHIFKSIPHELCWAKTTHDGNPGINVVEHCRNVGYVANALVAIFPDRIRRLFPASTAILAACHDIGKVSPEFQSQCEMWLEKYGLRDRTLREGWTAVQADHAAYSQASLLNYFGKE